MRRIALVGGHPDTKLGAPYADAEWTIWACSMQNMRAASDGGLEADLPRWNAWFELHTPMGLHVASGQVPDDYVAWLCHQPVVYVRDPAQAFAGARLYPEAEMRAKFGPFFFTSSIAYMLALAISKEPTEIGLWGVGMHKHEEYEYQRPGCHYFIQRAWDHGIKVTSAEPSILQPPQEKW